MPTTSIYEIASRRWSAGYFREDLGKLASTSARCSRIRYSASFCELAAAGFTLTGERYKSNSLLHGTVGSLGGMSALLVTAAWHSRLRPLLLPFAPVVYFAGKTKGFPDSPLTFSTPLIWINYMEEFGRVAPMKAGVSGQAARRPAKSRRRVRKVAAVVDQIGHVD